MPASRNARNSAWSFLFFVVMLAFGFSVIGYWQTYDMTCPFGRDWQWTTFPPQFVCHEL